MRATKTKASPCVKWVGGKRQLIPHINRLMPGKIKNYYEPFFGGGALFIELTPQNAVINDLNPSLISLYRIIASNPEELIETVEAIDEAQGDDPKGYYYSQRARYNNKIASQAYDVEAAALLLFLNKHCFNGLYRVNSKGEFNVPYNGSTCSSIQPENIRALSRILSRAEILNLDFEAACANAAEGDFVFFDSPYAPLNPTSFESYTKEGFAIEDHKRLAKLYEELTERGVMCMLTNHNTELIRELYGNYTTEVVSVRRSINSNASKRTGTEIIVTNY